MADPLTGALTPEQIAQMTGTAPTTTAGVPTLATSTTGGTMATSTDPMMTMTATGGLLNPTYDPNKIANATNSPYLPEGSAAPTPGPIPMYDSSVESRVADLTNSDSKLMQQAQTGAMQYANKRGLLNSSIAATAGQDAALRVAMPIASQEAAQAHQLNTQGKAIESSESIAAMNVSAHDKQYLAAATADLQKTYAAMFTEIQKNPDLTAAQRNEYYGHAKSVMDTNIQFLEQIYNVDLTWAQTPATVS